MKFFKASIWKIMKYLLVAQKWLSYEHLAS